MTVPEFSRPFARDTIGSAARTVEISADESERGALAKRFGLLSLEGLDATATLAAIAGGIEVRGQIEAKVTQACVVTGDPVPATIEEPFALRFVETLALPGSEEELELSDTDLDVLPLEGGMIDLGEAVAQTLGLALDPFPRSPGAGDSERKWSAGPDAGPFAALKGLR